MSLESALRLSGVLAAASSLLISVEYAVLARGGLFARGNLLDWGVLATLRRWTSVGRAARLLEAAFAPGPFNRLIGLQAFLSLVMGVGVLTGAFLLTGIASLGLFLIGLLLAVRHPYGRDGADEMLSLLLIGLAVACLVPYPTVKMMAVLFVCGQLTLSYLVAGIAKLGSRAWMRQGVLGGILNTEVYGRQTRLGEWFHTHPRLDLACGLFVVFMEVGYPLIFFIPRPFAVGWLVVTLGFHFATAVLMGLNTFLFVFSGAIALMYWLLTSGHNCFQHCIH